MRGIKRGRWEVERERCRIEEKIPRPALRDADPIGSIVDGVIAKVLPRELRWASRLCAEWVEMVGGTVAQHTRPGRVDGSHLYVYVDSSVWLNELKRYGQKEMLDNIQCHLGKSAITALHLVPDPDSDRS